MPHRRCRSCGDAVDFVHAGPRDAHQDHPYCLRCPRCCTCEGEVAFVSVNSRQFAELERLAEGAIRAEQTRRAGKLNDPRIAGV